MGMRKRYTYHPRKTRTGYVWEYTINEEAGLPTDWCERRRSSGIPVVFGRSGNPTQRSEEEIVRFCIKRIDQLRSEYRESRERRTDPTLWDIVEPYYTEDRCPHLMRLRVDGREVTERWRVDQRDRLLKYVRDYPIGGRRYSELIPGDFEQWKQRMRRKSVKVSVINKTITALKTALGEEYNQGRIKANPLMGVSHIKSDETDRGYFTLEELYRMFVSESPECWRSQRGAGSKYGKISAETASLMWLWQLLTGERMAAILELRWGDIEFGTATVTYRRTKTQTGRMAPLPGALVAALKDHMDRSIRIAPGDYVFSYDSGERIGYTLFRTRYTNMREALGLPERDPDGGKRTPYSLKVSLETHLLDAGADPLHVREYMGHSHGAGEKSLTRVQARYKRRRVEVLRERIIPMVDGLLSDAEKAAEAQKAKK